VAWLPHCTAPNAAVGVAHAQSSTWAVAVAARLRHCRAGGSRILAFRVPPALLAGWRARRAGMHAAAFHPMVAVVPAGGGRRRKPARKVTAAWFVRCTVGAYRKHMVMTMPATFIPLEALLERRLGASRARLLLEMFRFGVVGGVGFLVDAGVLLAMLALGLGPYGGRVVSYVVAASATFALNRAWTFRAQPKNAAPVRQWALFLALNLIGFACNYGAYAALISTIPLVARYPVLGVAAGSLAGMTGNFLLSRRYVFGAGVKAKAASPPVN
jgi:putative flippase GtrA